jgi:NitT/TauT family transport system permease protein
VLWEVASQHYNKLFVPSPQSVIIGIKGLIDNGMLITGLEYSFMRITLATLLAAAISIPLGLAIYSSKILQDTLRPVVDLMRYIPITAFYPLLIMWFGIDEEMKIAFLFLATFVYMLPSVLLSLYEIRYDLIDTGISIGMSRFQILSKIILPASIPSIIQTFIMMYGIGWTYIVVDETTNAQYGLGYIINLSSARGRTDLVFASILVIMLFSIIFDNFGKFIVRKCFRWRFIKNNDSTE